MICINNFQNILKKQHWEIYEKAVVLVMYCPTSISVAAMSYRNLTVGHVLISAMEIFDICNQKRYQWPDFFGDTIIPYHQTTIVATSGILDNFDTLKDLDIVFSIGQTISQGFPFDFLRTLDVCNQQKLLYECDPDKRIKVLTALIFRR